MTLSSYISQDKKKAKEFVINFSNLLVTEKLAATGNVTPDIIAPYSVRVHSFTF